MKRFRITVNGKTYEVEVEEIGGEEIKSTKGEPSAASVPKVEAPRTKTESSKKAAPAGKLTINAPMPGTILAIKVKAGDIVKRGDLIMILEAMKMENEILAPQDGTIVSIEVTEGTSVNTGDLLAVME